MKIKNGMIHASEGMWINRKGDRAQFTSAYILPNDTIEDFEERAELFKEPDPADLPAPKEDSEENKMINALIRAEYTESEELSINRQKDASPEKHAEWEKFNAFCEKCKAQVKAGKAQ